MEEGQMIWGVTLHTAAGCCLVYQDTGIKCCLAQELEHQHLHGMTAGLATDVQLKQSSSKCLEHILAVFAQKDLSTRFTAAIRRRRHSSCAGETPFLGIPWNDSPLQRELALHSTIQQQLPGILWLSDYLTKRTISKQNTLVTIQKHLVSRDFTKHCQNNAESEKAYL